MRFAFKKLMSSGITAGKSLDEKILATISSRVMLRPRG